MTEEFDIMEAFQRIRQRLRNIRQPRNIGSIAEALQEPRLVHDNFNFTVSPLPPDLDWRPVHIQEDAQIVYREAIAQANVYETLDDSENEDDNGLDIMECMAWAYLPEEIKDDICTRFYHGIPSTHQILLTRPDEYGIGGMGVTGATVEICRDDYTVQLRLANEVIAWYTSAYLEVDDNFNLVMDDKHHPIFFVYDYDKLGRLFLGAAQLLWNALGYPVYIENERYILDDETAPWETINDAELRDYVHNRIKQFGQLSGNFGVFKKKVRNARRRRSLL